MVIEPFVRMGPPPRSLAAEANDCFMVRPRVGPTEYKVAARYSRAMAGSPRILGEQREATVAQRRDRQRIPCGMAIPFRNGTENRDANKSRGAHHEIRLTPKAPYKFRPVRAGRLPPRLLSERLLFYGRAGCPSRRSRCPRGARPRKRPDRCPHCGSVKLVRKGTRARTALP
jgi:hypothetical protein